MAALALSLVSLGAALPMALRRGRERGEAVNPPSSELAADVTGDSQALALQLLPSRVDGHLPADEPRHVINLHVALQQNNAGAVEKVPPPPAPPPPPPPASSRLQALGIRTLATVALWELIKLAVRVKMRPEPPLHQVLLSSISSSFSAMPQRRRTSRWRS